MFDCFCGKKWQFAGLCEFVKPMLSLRIITVITDPAHRKKRRNAASTSIKHLLNNHIRKGCMRLRNISEKWSIMEPSPSKKHPQIDQNNNANKLPKRRPSMRVDGIGRHPLTVTYFGLPYTLYHHFVLYSLATNPSERPSGPDAAGAAGFRGLRPTRQSYKYVENYKWA